MNLRLSHVIRCESGAGSILVVAIVGAMLMVVGIIAPVGAVLATRQRTAGAADAAALAAADTAIGIRSGVPCAAAAETAAANEARLAGCFIDGVIATVRVESIVGFALVSSQATAGPPPG